MSRDISVNDVPRHHTALSERLRAGIAITAYGAGGAGMVVQ